MSIDVFLKVLHNDSDFGAFSKYDMFSRDLNNINKEG